MRKIGLLILWHIGVWTFLTPAILGQNITIRGKILDSDTKETLPFCRVSVEGKPKMWTATDEDGNFTLSVDATAKLLTASMVGYDTIRKKINPTALQQEMNFELRSANQTLTEFVVKSGENPSHRIVRGIIKRKSINRPAALPRFVNESYTKTEFDLLNIDEKLRKSKLMKPFSFIFDNIDSTSDEKPFLPVYMVETLADNFHTEGEQKLKSVPKAEKVAGKTNESIVEIIRDMQSSLDVYDNWIYVLNKPFVSPFAESGLFFYEYYISDSFRINTGQKAYKIRYKPRRKQETTFFGEFIVMDSTFAIDNVNLRMSPDVNINLVNRIILFQGFTQQPLQNQAKNGENTEGSIWLPARTRVVIDFRLTEKSPSMIVRKTVSYRDYQFPPVDAPLSEPAKSAEDLTSAELVRDNDFWEKARHEKLSKNESAVYKMIDSVRNVPVFKTYIDVIQTVFTGYKKFGKVEIGPYFSIFSRNQIEGARLRMGLQTTQEFNEKLRLGGYVAYGLQDREVKYGVNFQYNISRKPRIIVGGAYAHDLTQTNNNTEAIAVNNANLFSNFYRRPVLQKLMAVNEAKVFYENFMKKGWSNRITLLNRTMQPLGDFAQQRGFNLAFMPSPDAPTRIDSTIHTTEAIFKIRYAHGEKYIDGAFNRLKVGKRDFVFQAQYSLGNYGKTYHKFEVGIGGYFDINPIGRMNFQLDAGQTFGLAPFLLLHVAEGNETYFYSKQGFNGMNRYEFAGDRYVTLAVTHHFGGLLLNKIPLLRKLNLREVATFKAFMSDMSPENLAANSLNIFNPRAVRRNNYAGFRTCSTTPYMEATVGIENIFKVLRVDAVWRLNYLDNPEAARFKFHVGFDFQF